MASNHPTPKLKIKFGDMSAGGSGKGVCTASTVPNTSAPPPNHVDDSDKEGPNKKAKGRPPKKRGISEISAPTPPTMEELKRQSLMYREMIMKDFKETEERDGKSSGSKRKKKSKKSKRGPGEVKSETDDSSVRSKSPELKVITDSFSGPKLILRFGKNRTASVASNDGSSSTSNNNNVSENVKKENGAVAEGEGGGLRIQGPEHDLLPTPDRFALGDNDSGFTGSEGSVGSGQHNDPPPLKSKLGGPNKSKQNKLKLQIQPKGPETSSLQPVDVKREEESESQGTQQPGPSQTGPSPATFPAEPPPSPNPKPIKEKLMPIRLKLSRCYEGYKSKNEVEREAPKPTTADSCEVR
jgi:hypothetical protein